MAFLTEPEPPRGQPHEVAAGVRRIVARNPGAMTYHGTNTYLLDGPDGVVLIDPGPEDAAHLADVLAAADRPIRHVVLTHTHHDHVGGLAALRAATGAAVYGYHTPQDTAVVPDVALHDGDVVAGLTALHTPGHAPDHLCLSRADGVLFSADHVMSWSSSVIGGAPGDMAAYFTSLHRLIARDDTILLPGHGPAILDPAPFLQHLLRHRLHREAAIMAALAAGPRGSLEMVDAIYGPIDPRLRAPAQRNVLAHLDKLIGEARVVTEGDQFRLV